MHRIGVAARDRDLEHLETAALQPDVVDGRLRDEPRGRDAVAPDERQPGPRLVVVEDLPEPFARAARRAGSVVRRHREELVAQPGVAGSRQSIAIERHHRRGYDAEWEIRRCVATLALR